MKMLLAVSVAVLSFLMASCNAHESSAISEAVAIGLRAAADTSLDRVRRALNLATLTVGRCSFKENLVAEKTCGSVLYLPFRNGNDTSCRSRWHIMVDCVLSIVDACWGGTSPNIEIHKFVLLSYFNTTTNVNLFCDDGGLRRTVPSSVTSVCNVGMAQSTTQCRKPFHDAYDANRGDPGLCSMYETALICGHNVMEQMCSAAEDIDTALAYGNMITGKEANPFCSKSQGGGDAWAIIAGTSAIGRASNSSSSSPSVSPSPSASHSVSPSPSVSPSASPSVSPSPSASPSVSTSFSLSLLAMVFCSTIAFLVTQFV